MGTDIFLFAERRVQGAWQPVPEPVRDTKSGNATPREAMEMARPYGLFSILCGGAVGPHSRLVEMPAAFPPRGFPRDMNPTYRASLPSMYVPEHGDWGASWLELDELLAFDWDQQLCMHSYVEERLAPLFHRDAPFPTSFPKKTEELYHGLYLPPPDGTRKVEWSISLRDHVECSEWFLEQLTTLAAGETLRIIYWFDS